MELVKIESYEECPRDVDLAVWTGDSWEIDYVTMCSDTGSFYSANGIEFTHYIELPNMDNEEATNPAHETDNHDRLIEENSQLKANNTALLSMLKDAVGLINMNIDNEKRLRWLDRVSDKYNNLIKKTEDEN